MAYLCNNAVRIISGISNNFFKFKSIYSLNLHNTFFINNIRFKNLFRNREIIINPALFRFAFNIIERLFALDFQKTSDARFCNFTSGATSLVQAINSRNFLIKWKQNNARYCRNQ